jgi:hypothetical protein
MIRYVQCKEQNSIYCTPWYQDATQYCGPLTGVILYLHKKKPPSNNLQKYAHNVAVIMFVEICDAECSDPINTVGISQRNYNAPQLTCHHKYNDDYDNVDHDDDPITYEARFSCCIYLFCTGVKLCLSNYEKKTEHGPRNKIWI